MFHESPGGRKYEKNDSERSILQSLVPFFVKMEFLYFILKRTKNLLNMNIHESIDKWIVLILPVCIPEVLFLN